VAHGSIVHGLSQLAGVQIIDVPVEGLTYQVPDWQFNSLVRHPPSVQQQDPPGQNPSQTF
jgi:hypothetical protein